MFGREEEVCSSLEDVDQVRARLFSAAIRPRAEPTAEDREEEGVIQLLDRGYRSFNEWRRYG